jgi:hypothetical protein
MISEEQIEAFNARPRANLNDIKNLTPAAADRVKSWGSNAEALLTNRDLALFVHQFKFETSDALINITGHSPDDNAKRIALANQLSGIDGFISLLKRAVYMKNRVVSHQTGSEGPDANT